MRIRIGLEQRMLFVNHVYDFRRHSLWLHFLQGWVLDICLKTLHGTNPLQFKDIFTGTFMLHQKAEYRTLECQTLDNQQLFKWMQKRLNFSLFTLIVAYLHIARHTDGRGWCGEFGVESRLAAVVRMRTLWEQTGLGPGKIRKLDKYKTINNYLLTRRWRAWSCCVYFITLYVGYEIQTYIYCYLITNSWLKEKMKSKSRLDYTIPRMS